MNLGDLILAGIGGFIGCASRYAATCSLAALSGRWGFPLGTLAVNALGSLLAGLLMGWCTGRWYALAVAGFCGGFTTFSTFSAEVFGLLRTGHPGAALLYAVGSLALGLACVWIGHTAAARWFG